MSFGEAVRTCLAKYAEFRGNATRPEFWYFYAFHLAVSGLPSLLGRVTGIAALTIAGWGLGLLLLLPQLAVVVRRLHDAGRPGSWAFIAFVPVVGVVILLAFLASPSRGGSAGRPGAYAAWGHRGR
ncbi:MAG TPA: DUF805 domain-containing protein [Kineosporiaceae bacterium]|nr:DUF805 domain-containing protein [Kineosporiaceae bacterium]